MPRLKKPKENQCFWEAPELGNRGFEVPGLGHAWPRAWAQGPGPRPLGPGPKVPGRAQGPGPRAQARPRAQGPVYIKLPINRTCGRYVTPDKTYHGNMLGPNKSPRAQMKSQIKGPGQNKRPRAHPLPRMGPGPFPGRPGLEKNVDIYKPCALGRGRCLFFRKNRAP